MGRSTTARRSRTARLGSQVAASDKLYLRAVRSTRAAAPSEPSAVTVCAKLCALAPPPVAVAAAQPPLSRPCFGRLHRPHRRPFFACADSCSAASADFVRRPAGRPPAADCMSSVAVSGERSAPISPLAEQRGWELSNDQSEFNRDSTPNFAQTASHPTRKHAHRAQICIRPATLFNRRRSRDPPQHRHRVF